MDNYYVEILKNIRKNIDDGNIDEAYLLTIEELKMPYIPVEVEKELHNFMLDIKGLRSEKSSASMSIEQIENYLKGNDEQQLLAVNQLSLSNLRQNIELVESYLSSCDNKSAAVLLIDACIEQQIDETLIYHTSDIDYEFTPKYCVRPYDSEGFKKASVLISEWFESDDPSFFIMCMQLLIQCSFAYLPMSYEEDDAFCLALSVVKEVMGLMQYGNEWTSFINKMGFEHEKVMEIEY